MPQNRAGGPVFPAHDNIYIYIYTMPKFRYDIETKTLMSKSFNHRKAFLAPHSKIPPDRHLQIKSYRLKKVSAPKKQLSTKRDAWIRSLCSFHFPFL